ncbi:MAG: UDP-N-acetylmuramoyl-tripeptide--D-alanyl-D-alanine ligase [Bacteroidales bacterium]|nr:UDP-N-acetylmuramoyl-tripeptide--D-alanyl-D-alanine ligase [Bacteroidales bacterium]
MKQLLDIFLKNPDVCTDTRAIRAGCVFFALKGENFNGNLFAKEALDKGASCVVVDSEAVFETICYELRLKRIRKIDERIVFVPNVLRALQNLAKAYRQYLADKERLMPLSVIGITGTNGKTTTKELLNAVLSKRYKVHATQGNLNNHIGVPLTILSAPLDTAVLICEMGANHTGEIAELCEIVNPNYGIITSLGRAHLAGFGSFENIVKTKTALYRKVKENDGLVFVDEENEILMRCSEGMRHIQYGIRPEINPNNTENQLFGDYNFKNILAAAEVGKYFNIALDVIKWAIREYQPQNNRSQKIETESNILFMDAYNANPTSMQLAIESFKKLPDENKMYILGDMLELGDVSEEEHRKIIELVKKSENVKKENGHSYRNLLLVGQIFYEISPENAFKNVDLLINYLKKNPISNQSLLIKGSHSIHMEKVVDFL